jgi:hypothetical protein
LIKLHPEGFHQEFEADGINVGAGGISMRASVLPQVGSTLRCQLDNPSGGDAIEMIGRVVWAHESGEHAGEFGIRFTHLSSDDQVRIEALIQRWGRASAQAPTVCLQLDGVESRIVAELKSENDESFTVEQPLPFLAIGSGMSNETTGRRGHLEAVELRMDEHHTPRLVLSIGYEDLGASRESRFEEGGRDTTPDAPPVIRASQTSAQRVHDTPRIVRYDKGAEELPSESVTERLRAYAKNAAGQLASTAGSARSAVTEDLVPTAGSKVRELAALIIRFIQALRARLDDKPRRKQVPRSQAARAHLKNTRRSGRRVLALVAMVLGIVSAGWGIYLWAAKSAASGAEAETEAETEAEAEAEAEAETETEAEAEAETETEAETEAGSATEAATATEAGSASEVPVVEHGAPLPPEKVRGMAFGADSVVGGETYVLRMSNPVTEMDGIVEQSGFSVTIPGSLSLSRAGPIASAHPDIEHASILNRGDFSEFTVRFVAGRQPSYRVEARGPAIQLTIAR